MFGDLVRAHRRRLGLSQEDLAERSGMSVRGIRDLETGRTGAPRARNVRLLADVFGLAGREREEFHVAASPTAPARPSRPGRSPAQLPTDQAGFAGRDAPLHRLDALLEAGRDGPGASVIVVSGSAGVGKTALAVHWAHRVRAQFPDGQLFVNLRGFDPDGAATPSEALRVFLSGLGVTPEKMPPDQESQVALYRSLLAGRRVLVVLDNARDVAQVRPLLPSGSGCAVVVTSRRQLGGLVALESAQPVPLGVFDQREAREMLRRRLSPQRLVADAEGVDDVIRGCAGLPLALAVVAARAAAHSGLSLATIAKELRASTGGLDALAGPDPSSDVRAAFSWSYNLLDAPAARLFRLLSLHQGPHVGLTAAASLAGLPVAAVRPLLAELTGAHLLGEPEPGCYAFHDLLRAYAAELARSVDAADERGAAVRRLLDHYVHVTHAAALRLTPGRERIPLEPPAPGVAVETIADHDAALAWFAREEEALSATVRLAAEGGFDAEVGRLAWAVATYFRRRGNWVALLEIQDAALTGARRLGIPREEARARRGIARALVWLREDEAALRHLLAARELYATHGGDTEVAHADLELALVHERAGRYEAAAHCADLAYGVFTGSGDRPGQARALNMMGWCRARAGDPAGAVRWCRESIALYRRIPDGAGEANAWDSYGYVLHRLGRHAQAAACYRRSHRQFVEAGDRFGQAFVLRHLGDVLLDAGDPRAAGAAWAEALAIFEELRHPDAADVRAQLGALP
jgi:tetratricopeptide (TPR) repeat protein/transcriptional regulator with XRE-family HTH domain